MRHLRRFCAVFTLLCAFSFSAYAGNIECPGVTSEPPPPEATTSQTQSDAVSDSTITEVLLILVEGVLLVP
jgi:hypothetical protein